MTILKRGTSKVVWRDSNCSTSSCYKSLFQFSQREQCKKLHKMYFEGFHIDNWEDMAPRVKIVEEFFYDIFKNYNVQFWGMLGTKELVDSPENAMAKLAIDIIHRWECLKDSPLQFKYRFWLSCHNSRTRAASSNFQRVLKSLGNFHKFGPGYVCVSRILIEKKLCLVCLVDELAYLLYKHKEQDFSISWV